MLEKNEIAARNIVQYSHVNGVRDSTYDATVGTIIKKGKDQGSSYILKPRGVVWVVSQEEFHMPQDVTALATVRTTWAHKGVFALNVGVVDPGWKGPVATALVNFSMEDFEVKIGEGFMRLVFIEHTPAVSMPPPPYPKEQYVKEIKLKSLNFADSFLDLTTLVKAVARELFRPGKIATYLTMGGLILAFLAIFAPIAFTVWTDGTAGKAAVAKLERRVEQLEEADKKREKSEADARAELREKAARDDAASAAAANMRRSQLAPVEPALDFKRRGK